MCLSIRTPTRPKSASAKPCRNAATALCPVGGGASVQKPNHRHRRLLRARRRWPSDRRSAEKANELTSPHIRTQTQELALYRLKQVL
jgi:hypothetical protein